MKNKALNIAKYFFNIQVNHKAVGLSKFQHRPKYPVLISATIPQLTQEDIINFDSFYNKQTVSEFRDFKGKRVLIKKVYQPDIAELLHFKIGDNFESLINFLEVRDEFITDVEFAYCLIMIKNHHRHYLPPLASTYLVKINYLIEIGKFKFYSIKSLRDILEVHNCTNFLQEPSMIICIDYLLNYSQHLERTIEQRGEIDESHHSTEITLVYRTLLQLCSGAHKKNHAFESLMKIRKILTRKLALLPIQDMIGFLQLSSQHKNLLFTEVLSIQKMEEYLLQNYNVLELEEKVYSNSKNKIQVLKSFAYFPLNRSALAEKFYLEIQNQSLPISFQEFSTVFAAFSQLKFSPEIQSTYWQFMQDKFLAYEEIAKDYLILSKITQVFGQNQQGSLQFWKSIYGIFQDLKQNNYADDFTILQNFLRLGYVDDDLIEKITQQEVSGKEFKYLSSYSLEQKLVVFQIFTQAYYNYPTLRDSQRQAFNLLLNQLRQLVFNNEDDRDEIYKNLYMRLRYVLILNMALDITKKNDGKGSLEKQKQHIAQELQFAQRKIDRLMNKDRLNANESMFFYAILSSRQEKNARVLDLLTDNIEMKLQQMKNFEEFIKLAQLGYQINLTQPKIWSNIYQKILSKIGAFSITDLILMRNILEIYLKDTIQLELLMIQMSLQQNIPLFEIKKRDIAFKQCQNLDDLLRLLMVLEQ